MCPPTTLLLRFSAQPEHPRRRLQVGSPPTLAPRRLPLSSALSSAPSAMGGSGRAGGCGQGYGQGPDGRVGWAGLSLPRPIGWAGLRSSSGYARECTCTERRCSGQSRRRARLGKGTDVRGRTRGGSGLRTGCDGRRARRVLWKRSRLRGQSRKRRVKIGSGVAMSSRPS